MEVMVRNNMSGQDLRQIQNNTSRYENHIRLTSAEIAELWVSYMSASMQQSLLSHFLNTVDDVDVRSVLEDFFDHIQNHMKRVSEIFSIEKHSVPQGFTEKDVNINSPRLFSDIFILSYLEFVAIARIFGHGTALATSAREDIREYNSESLSGAAELYNKAVSTLLSKGIYIRAPYVSTPDKIDFVKNQGFLTGFLGERRPLSSIEISHIFSLYKATAIKRIFLTGFSQVVSSPNLRKHMVRGKDIASKHIEVLTSQLKKNDIPVSGIWDAGVTESTISPFSDNLSLYVDRVFDVISIANIGKAISISLRRDLVANYSRLLAETIKYAEDGANIMIKNGWLEEPPLTTNREALAKHLH